jgi:hypothetical protein
MLKSRHFQPATAGLVAAVLGLGAAIAGVSSLRAAEQAPAQAAAPRPMVPMTAASILRDPATHIGLNVSMMAAVETILTKTAFVVDQDKSKTAEPLLVIAPALTAAPDLNAYVTVQGEVLKFDPAEIAKRAKGYTLDLSPDQIAKFTGKPVILATAVITPGLTDLAKKPIRPMTPDEVTFSGYMKAINTSLPAVRASLEKPDAAELKTHVAALKQAFTDVEAFLKTKGPADAVKFASESLKAATAMEAALASGKIEDIKAPAGTIQGLCAQCHKPFRETMEDGTYRIRGSVR